MIDDNFDPVKCEKRHGDLCVSMIKIRGDVEHIKGRIDNGVSTSIKEILQKMDDIVPRVMDNTAWIDRIKGAFVWISVIAVGGGIAGILLAIIQKAVMKL